MNKQNNNHSIIKPKVLITNLESNLSILIAKQFSINGFEIYELISEEKQTQSDIIDLKISERMTLKEAEADLFCPDILILNHAKEIYGPFCEIPEEKNAHYIDQTFIKNLYIFKLIIKRMKERGHGKIFFSSSTGNCHEAPFEGLAGPTRAFISSLLSTLRKELKESSITLTGVLPCLEKKYDLSKYSFLEKEEEFAKECFYAIMSGKECVINPSRSEKIEYFFKHTLLDDSMKFFLH